jgi:uncharacterized phage-associated protein
MVPVGAVAEYLILKAQADDRTVDQLTLQKLVSYAQAFHLAAYEAPLFSNAIEAWEYGPVIRVLRFRFGKYKADPIDPSEATNPVVDAHVRSWLDEVWAAFGQFPGTDLANMWHEHEPYQEARATAQPGQPPHEVISPDRMSDYFQEHYQRWQPGYDEWLRRGYDATAENDKATAAAFLPLACRVLTQW